jgi:hypothetical protein
LNEIGGVGELAIDSRLHSVPEYVGDQQDDDGGQHAVDYTGEQRVPAGEVHEIDIPTPTEHGRRANDQEGPDTVFESYFDDAGRTASLGRTGGSEQMLDRAPARGDGGRQDDEYENEPKGRHHTHDAGCRNPDTGDPRLEAAERGTWSAVAGDLVEEVADEPGEKLFRQELRSAPIQMEIDPVLVVERLVCEVVGQTADSRKLMSVCGSR